MEGKKISKYILYLESGIANHSKAPVVAKSGKNRKLT